MHNAAASAPLDLKRDPAFETPERGPASLFHLYAKWFDVVPADTPDLLAEAFRLRHQVYCIENAYEDGGEHPNGLETDQYDAHSVHSLLVHRATGMVAGTVRLVLPDGSGRIEALPISRVCTEPDLRDMARFPPARTAEISRFAVSKAFRRRITDAECVDMHFLKPTARAEHAQERRILTPNITLGLMKAIAEMSIRHGISHLCAVMEPALLRLTKRLGIRFTPLGRVVEYHGIRQPCFAELAELGHALEACRPDALELISDRGRYWRGGQVAMTAE